MGELVRIDEEFEARMTNWRKTVRYGSGGDADGCCAGWARAYVKARDDREKAIALELKLLEPDSKLARKEVDELDGWLVESAVAVLPYFDQRELLRLKYVWLFPNHFLKDKLRCHNPRINDSTLRIIHARATSNLKNVLAKLEQPAKIRSHNLHARYVPRLKA